MLFDFAKTSKVRTGSQNDYTQVAIFAKLRCLSIEIGVFILPKGRYARSPLASLPVGVEPPCRAMKTAIF
jgi:hypothetical protein